MSQMQRCIYNLLSGKLKWNLDDSHRLSFQKQEYTRKHWTFCCTRIGMDLIKNWCKQHHRGVLLQGCHHIQVTRKKKDLALHDFAPTSKIIRPQYNKYPGTDSLIYALSWRKNTMTEASSYRSKTGDKWECVLWVFWLCCFTASISVETLYFFRPLWGADEVR